MGRRQRRMWNLNLGRIYAIADAGKSAGVVAEGGMDAGCHVPFSSIWFSCSFSAKQSHPEEQIYILAGSPRIILLNICLFYMTGTLPPHKQMIRRAHKRRLNMSTMENRDKRMLRLREEMKHWCWKLGYVDRHMPDFFFFLLLCVEKRTKSNILEEAIPSHVYSYLGLESHLTSYPHLHSHYPPL